MCRNIKTLHNYSPPVTNDEIHAAALQYVRKVSGMRKPSQANQGAFERAIAEIALITGRLIREELSTAAAPRDRAVEAEKAKARGRKRDARMRERLQAELAESS